MRLSTNRSRFSILAGMAIALSASSHFDALNTGREHQADLLTGYAVLSAPRTKLEIGSHWVDEVGPTGPGIPSDQLQTTASLGAAQLNQAHRIRVGIAVSLARKIGFNLSGRRHALQFVRIEEAELVRVPSLQSISFSAGSDYLWEGLRVKKFTVLDAAVSDTELEARLEQKTEGGDSLSVRVSAGAGRTRVVTVSGGSLFIAFRVVRVGRAQDRIVGEVRWPANAARRRWRMGDFVIEFNTLSGAEAAAIGSGGSASMNWPEPRKVGGGCVAKMTLTSRTMFDIGGVAAERSWPMWCRNAASAGSYVFGLWPVGNTVVRSVLDVEQPGFVADSAQHTVEAYGHFTLEETVFPLSSVQNPRAPGYGIIRESELRE